MHRVAVFASGNGTNAEEIFRYFKGHQSIEIATLFCNNSNAAVIQRAETWRVPAFLFDRGDLKSSSKVLDELNKSEVEWLVLAGFLWLMPPSIVEQFPSRIINIHPALLPKFGGKGMYGGKVHEAVIDSGDKESGITIHLVNDIYDEGQIIFQDRCIIDPNDTANSLAEKIHRLEHRHFPRIIEKCILESDGFA
jgi:phosphoribosylglycinamide formyltransferase-1